MAVEARLSQEGARRPPLSVVVAIRDPWPAARPCIDALYPQAVASGAEIIIAVTDRGTLPADADRLYPALTVLEAGGASVFQLRSLAFAHAHGDVVALTEDHARVRPDWCRRILEAHHADVAAAAIGGAVENAATDTLRDWASFFVASGGFMLPIRSGESRSIALQANVSYKRRALPGQSNGLGMMQMPHHAALVRRGEKLVADDRIVVDHDQALGFLEHCAGHFHNGRSIAAFRLPQLSATLRALRAAGCLVLPSVMLWRTMRTVLRKRRHTAELFAGLPFIVSFLLCHAAGELAGYVSGPGKSPQYVR